MKINISKELAARKRSIKRNKMRPYERYADAQRITSQYYANNEKTLLDNEQCLITRYKKLSRKSNKNPVGHNTILTSIVCSMLATIIFMLLSGADNIPGITEIYVNVWKEACQISQSNIYSLSQLTLHFAPLVLSAIVIILISSICLLCVIKYTSFLFTETFEQILIEYEIELIKKLLEGKYSKMVIEKNSESMNTTHNNISTDMSHSSETKPLSNKEHSFLSTICGEYLQSVFFLFIILLTFFPTLYIWWIKTGIAAICFVFMSRLSPTRLLICKIRNLRKNKIQLPEKSENENSL